MIDVSRHHLLTMAHSAEHYRQEAIYLLLTWLRERNFDTAPCRALVATDKPESFLAILGERPEIAYLPLDMQQLLTWRGGPDGYVHRIKPQLIAYAAQYLKLGKNDALMFVDSDTAFHANPSPLFDLVMHGFAVLHTQEGNIANNRHHTRSQRRLYKLARSQALTMPGSAPYQLNLHMPLWNSGAIGLRGDMVQSVMEQTLALTDAIYKVLPIGTAEQIACSIVLHEHSIPVRTAEPFLLHYHMFKEFRADVAAFLEYHAGATSDEWITLSSEIDPVYRIVPKLAFNMKPKWWRQLRKIFYGSWQRMPYPWD